METSFIMQTVYIEKNRESIMQQELKIRALEIIFDLFIMFTARGVCAKLAESRMFFLDPKT